MIFLGVLLAGVILFTLYTNSICQPDPMDDPEVRRLLGEPEPAEPRERIVIWPIAGGEETPA